METLLICLEVIIVIMIIGLVLGLVEPTMVLCKSRRQVAAYFGIPLVLCLIISQLIAERVREKDALKHAEQVVLREMAETKQKAAFPIGETTKEAYFSCKVRNMSFRKSFGDGQYGLGSTADGIYLIIDISIKNLSDRPRRFPFNDFYVTDTNGVRYTYQDYVTTLFRSEESGIADWDFEKLNGTRMFQPNVPTRDCILFEVPQRGKYFLHFAGTAVIPE